MVQLLIPCFNSNRISIDCRNKNLFLCSSSFLSKATNVSQQLIAFSTEAASLNGMITCCLSPFIKPSITLLFPTVLTFVISNDELFLLDQVNLFTKDGTEFLMILAAIG